MGRLGTAGAAAFLPIGGFLFGYDSGIIASTIAQPHFVEYMGTPTTSEQGGIVSSFTGGAILGPLSIAYLADTLGRKKSVFIGSTVSCIGCALQAGVANIPMMIAGHPIAGMSVGLLSAVVPMYCSEIAVSEDRGKLSGLLQFMLSWGGFHRTVARLWLLPGRFCLPMAFPACFPGSPGPHYGFWRLVPGREPSMVSRKGALR